MIHYKKDTDNIVTLTLDMKGRAENVINQKIWAAFVPVIEHLQLEKKRGQLRGVILTSSKKTFLADRSGAVTMFGFRVYSTGVHIEGFTVDMELYMQNGGTANPGIYLYGSHHTVKGCTFVRQTGYAIQIGQFAYTSDKMTYITIESNFDIYGCLVGGSIDIDSNTRVHYDTQLAEKETTVWGPYIMKHWREVPERP